jgi:hypothetical protein
MTQKFERRRKVRNRLLGLALGVIAILCVAPAFTFAQTIEQAAPSGGQAAVQTPDISGIWSRLRGTGATARGYKPLFLELSPTEPPMTPWALAKYKANRAAYRENPNTNLSDPVMSCFPPGLPRIYLLGFPVQIIQIPGQVIMLFEYDHFIRRIYTDGRPHDTDQGLLWMGDSIGKWDGNTLVTDTANFNDKTLIDRVGHPHSDAMHMTEHIRRVDHNTLEIEITLDDPKAFTKPWGTKLVFEFKPEWKMMEDVCEDNSNFLEFNKKVTEAPKK